MKRNWLHLVVIVLMSACSGLTEPTPDTAPPVVINTPQVLAPTLTATLEPTPAVTLEPDYQLFSPVIARMFPGPFYLLGGTQNGEWLSPETVIPHISNETYQVFGMHGPTGSSKGEEPIFEAPCQIYRVETDSYPLSGPAVGVTENWDVTPRLVEEFPVDTPAYIDEIRNWLIDKGFPEPVVEISQVLRVDIEGDGSDEVLISASHFVEPTGHDVEFGDYSLVLMRKVVGDSVRTIPIVADYYYESAMQFPLTYALTFPADLNNDGVLEVLIGVQRWEGSGIIAFEIDGTTASPVFEALCGL